MRKLIAAAALVAIVAGPAGADEVEETLEAALEAYRAGDIALAKEEVDFAAQLIAQQKAAGLAAFLPGPLDGWEKEESGSEGASPAMFGGGSMASATYKGEAGRVEIQMMADNQMVASMAAMLGNAAMMGQMGTVKRKGRQKYVVTNQGEVQALVDNRILVQISGSADAAVKEAYFEAIDLEGLAAF